MTRNSADSQAGGIVVGWLVKVVLIFGLIALIVFEIVTITYANVSANDDAKQIARAGANVLFVQRGGVNAALTAAELQAQQLGLPPDEYEVVIEPGQEVSVTVTEPIDTLIVESLGFLEPFHYATATFTAENSSF